MLHTPWGKAIKRSIFIENKLRFNCFMKCCEDTALNIILFSKINTLQILASSLYIYYLPTALDKYNLSLQEYRNYLKILNSSKDSANKLWADLIVQPGYEWLYGHFMTNFWKTSFLKGIHDSIIYQFCGVIKYMPFSRLTKIRKLIAILLIPYIKLLKK